MYKSVYVSVCLSAFFGFVLLALLTSLNLIGVASSHLIIESLHLDILISNYVCSHRGDIVSNITSM